MNRKVRIGSLLALIAALALTGGILFLADVWWFERAYQRPYAKLTGGGLLAAAAVVGSLWRDRTPVRILRRSLIVLALLALIVGTGFLALAWLGVGTKSTGRLSAGFAGSETTTRAFGVLFGVPLTGSVVWLLGAMALLARRRFTAAAVYTLSAFAAIVAITAIVILPQFVPFLATVGLVAAPGWIGALVFLALDAAAVYVAWTKLFGSDFVKAEMRGTK